MSTTIGTAILGKIVKEDFYLGEGSVSVPAPAGGLQTGTQLNVSAFGYNVSVGYAPSLPVAALSFVTADITVNGALVRHPVVASFDGAGYVASKNLILSARVTADNTVTITIFNPTGAPVALGSGTLRVSVLMFPTSF